jgi:hypothetical protein
LEPFAGVKAWGGVPLGKVASMNVNESATAGLVKSKVQKAFGE